MIFKVNDRNMIFKVNIAKKLRLLYNIIIYLNTNVSEVI